MKKLIYILGLLAVIPFLFNQCDSEDNLVTKDSKEGGLVDILTPSLNYVVGNGAAYSFTLKVYQGSVLTTKVDFYRSFYSVNADTAGGNPWSNEVKEPTIPVTDKLTKIITSPGYNYAALRRGLAYAGGAGDSIPTSDGGLSIGDAFFIKTVTTTSDGRTTEQAVKVKLTVATRYAGKYKPIDALYYRIGVLTYTVADWPTEISIESVDAITYKMLEYVGPFTGQTVYFQINEGVISYPLKWAGADQLINGFGLITCVDNAGDMTGVKCDESNKVVKDDANGKDKLYMSFGYMTTTGTTGPRVFYQVLEKIVE
jgi:hypothetical protein